MTSAAELLRRAPYFATLSNQEMARLEQEAIGHTYDKGELLFLEGEPCPGLYIVRSGQIRIFKTSPEGREQVLFLARAGDTFNDVPVFDEGPNPASASALEPSSVYIVPKETVLSLVAGCPAARAIIKILGSRLRHLTFLVEDLSFRRVVSRLAKTLLDLAAVEGGAAPIARLTQDELAARIGTARDVIGRSLKALEKEGAIKMVRQRIIITNAAKLKEII